ncbi:MAG TPA: hypothetical protein VID70_11200 [Solirubrobacteraceae bacterium]|jgi:hypothetical protein
MQGATLTRPGTRWPGPARLARLRSVPASTWAKLGFAVLCVGALVGYLAIPTYPTYDSYYALIWGRDVLHLHLPVFQVYRAPTEHPLAIAFGVLASVFGQAGDRVMIFGAIASFVALAAGLYRLGRLTFGPLVGMIAAAILCTRFDYEYYAAQGYLDFSYMALVVWAGALEAARPRRGALVFVMLAAAGLLRPDAWLLSGVYFLWCAWPTARSWQRGKPLPTTGWRTLAGYAALTVAAPLLWALVDLAVTGDPAYSLHSTAGLAEALGRTQGLGNIPGSAWEFMVRLDKLPLVLGGIAGVIVGVLLLPTRIRVPLALLFSGLLTFALLGAAGTSVIDRYLLMPAVLVMLFGALAIGGWSLLEPGSALRRVWMVAAALLVAVGVAQAVATVSLKSIRTELSFRKDSHRALAQVLHNPRVRADLERCGPLSLPNHKLMPDARWILNVGPENIVGRSQARVEAAAGDEELRERISRGVAIYPTGEAVFRQAIVDANDDPLDQVPPRGWAPILTSQYYAVYARCA